MTPSPEPSQTRKDETPAAFRPPGIAVSEYRQGLVTVRSRVLEQDLLTDTAHRAPKPKPESAAAVAPRLSPVCAVLGGRFELEERIGKGGTGDIYRTRDLLADQYDREHSTVAVKVLRPDLVRDPPLVRDILRAAARMRRLRHPNIAQVFDIQYLDGDYLIVSELLEGQSLAERLDSRAFPVLTPGEVNAVMKDIASALEHAHAHGVVHGDLKPGNVFLTGNRRAVVLDFGFCGLTRLYASPEVLDGQPPTPVDDVYSLAALVYRLTTGNWPYGNLDASEAALSGARPARPSTMAPDQWQTLQQGLAPRRSARFQTVADFVAAYTSRPDPLPARGIGAATTMALLAGLGVLAWQALPYWKSEMEGRAAGVARSAERAPALALNAPTPAPPPVAAPLPAPVSVPVTVPLAVPLIPEQAPVTVPPAAPAGPPRIYLSPTGQLVVSESDPYVRLRVRGAGLREPVTVGVEARSGSAEMNQDFVPPPASVRLTPRHSTAEILVSLIGDDRKENVEDFGVELSVADGNAALATRSAVVILTDDD